MSRKRHSPFESPSEHLVSRRQATRLVRNFLLLAGLWVLLLDQVGEPLLRWEYSYRRGDPNKSPLNATYYGLSGRYESGELGYTGGYPVVFFSRPDPPLWQRACDGISSILP